MALWFLACFSCVLIYIAILIVDAPKPLYGGAIFATIVAVLVWLWFLFILSPRSDRYGSLMMTSSFQVSSRQSESLWMRSRESASCSRMHLSAPRDSVGGIRTCGAEMALLFDSPDSISPLTVDKARRHRRQGSENGDEGKCG